MALIKCTECGKKISDQASSCPNCGAPLTQESISKGKSNIENSQFNKKAIIIACSVGAAFLLMLVIAFVSSSGNPDNMDTMVYKYSLKALEVTDDYLDVKITADEAFDMLKDYDNKVEDICNKKEVFENDSAKNKIYFIYSSIYLSSTSGNYSYKDVLDARNDLATLINKKARTN